MGNDISVQPGTLTQAELAAAQQAAQAAYQANLTWRATNEPGSVKPGEQQYATQILNYKDAAAEQQKHDIAFSQPRNDLKVQQSQSFQDIQAQYAAQQNRVVGPTGAMYQGPARSSVNPYPENTAAGIAWEVGKTGGSVEAGLARTAVSEGLSPSQIYVAGIGSQGGRVNVLASDVIAGSSGVVGIESGRETIPIRDLSSGMQNTPMFRGDGGTVTTYMPYGSYQQVSVRDSKIALDYNTGELGVYQLPAGHSYFMLVGGGGRAALQSGMFTFDKPGTVDPSKVFEQWDSGNREGVSKSYSEGMSSLGAEAYGGFAGIQLDSRKLSPESKMSVYDNIYNLANYVNPQGANLSKVEAPGAKIPWTMEQNSPAIQYMDERGLTGVGVTFSGNLVGGGGGGGSTNQPLPNIYDLYDAKSSEYTSLLKSYEAGGSSDLSTYNELQSMRKEVVALGYGRYGADVMNQVFAKQEVEKPTPQANFYDILAPEGSLQRSVLGNISIVPLAPSIGTQIEMGQSIANGFKTGDIGAAWTSVNKPMSEQYAFALPDIKGFSASDVGKGLAATAVFANPLLYPVVTSDVGRTALEFTGAAGKEMYTRSREYPLENIALAAVPLAFKAGEYYVASGIARATVEKSIPGIATIGRAMSTPLATDVGQYLVKGALVAPWIIDSAKNIYEAPMTAEGKGKAVGEVGYQIAWMGAGSGIAEGFRRFAPENEFYGKGFFTKQPEPRPVQQFIGDVKVGVASAEMKVRGYGEEANFLSSYWEAAKTLRFKEPAEMNPKPLSHITDVPVEHQKILENALLENVAAIYGSGSTYGQAAKGTRFGDTRLSAIDAINSKEFQSAGTMSERIDVVMKYVEPEPYPEGKFPISAGADVDVMGSAKGITGSLSKEPGAILQVKVEGSRGIPKNYYISEFGGETIKIYEPGYEAPTRGSSRYISLTTAEAEMAAGRMKFEDIQSIYAKGAKFALDVHEPAHGYPSIRGSEGYRIKSDAYTPEDWRMPLTFKILGSPFETVPRQSDIMYFKDSTGKMIPQEKIGFQLQRLGDALTKDLMSGIERVPGDPLYRGYRFEKDVYRSVSTVQSMLATERARLETARSSGKTKEKTLDIREQNLQVAEKHLNKILETDLRYQLARGEEPVLTKTRDLMKIGLERLESGMSVSGSNLGPVRTTIGESKFLKEYPKPESRDIVKEIAFEKKFIPKESQILQPRTIKQTQTSEGAFLKDIAYKGKSTAERLAKYKTEPVEKFDVSIERDVRDIIDVSSKEPSFTREYRFASPESTRPSILSRVEPVTLLQGSGNGRREDSIMASIGNVMQRESIASIRGYHPRDSGIIASMRGISSGRAYSSIGEYSGVYRVSTPSLYNLPSVFNHPSTPGGRYAEPPRVPNYGPPSAPTYKPPSVPEIPYYEPPRPPTYKIPPVDVFPGGGVGGFGGGGGWGMGMTRTRKRNYQNPVVDIDYLVSLSGRKR